MNKRVVIMLVGVLISALGFFITLPAETLPGVTSCNENGCYANSGSAYPFLGIGAAIVFMGIVVVIYGYTRERDEA